MAAKPAPVPPTIFDYLAARERGPEAVAALWAGVQAPPSAAPPTIQPAQPRATAPRQAALL